MLTPAYAEIGINEEIGYFSRSFDSQRFDVTQNFTEHNVVHNTIIDDGSEPVDPRSDITIQNVDFDDADVEGPILYVGGYRDNAVRGSTSGDFIYGGFGEDILWGRIRR